MLAWILVCRACRTELSVSLTELELDVPPVSIVNGRDILPAGCLWRVRSGFVEFGREQPGDVLCCRRDLPAAQPGNGRTGCCGPSGLDGPNLRCVCGSDFATEFGDCWQPHIVCVHPKRVLCEPTSPVVATHIYPPKPSHPSAWQFAAWLHELLGAQDWYGLELDQLVQEWAGRTPTPIVILWLDPDRHDAAGVPVSELIERIDRSAQVMGAPISVICVPRA